MRFEQNYIQAVKKMYPYIDWDAIYKEFGFVVVIKLENQLKDLGL